MKRVIIRLNDKSFINVPGDSIDVCYLSEKKEETENA